MGAEQIFWTKNRHGSLQVRVTEEGGKRRFELTDSRERFESFKELMKHVAGRSQGSYERYFRVGKYARKDVKKRVGITVLEIFKKRSTGIDLQKRGHEVAKLLFAGYGSRIYAMGYDPEDVLQEVYKGLLIRNRGKGAWDASKSSFGSYVHMVCGCILSNFHKKQSRYSTNEKIGISEYRDGDWSEVDVAGSETLRGQEVHFDDVSEHFEDLSAWIRENKGEAKADFLCKILPYCVFLGMRRGEISQQLDLSPSKVGKALGEIREITSEWLSSRK